MGMTTPNYFNNMIIGICGRAQVGKDTVGKMINTMAYQRFEIRKFADELKYMTRILLNCTIEQLESIEYKNTPIAAMGGKTPRKIMQLLGTDFGRHMITPGCVGKCTDDGL